MTVKKISLSDIAKSLGVSKTLVSMVINNHADEKGISKETQKRVWEKVKELNYKPNMMARGLRLGRSNTIGFIVCDISNPFYSVVARYLENFLEAKGYSIIICSSDEDIEKELRLIRMLKDRQVDGLIISSTQKDGKEFQSLLDENFPFVLIDRKMNDINANSVIVDNHKGAYEGVTHLLNQGFKNIATFAITPIHVTTINDRIEGYLDAIKDFGLTPDKNLIKEIPFSDVKKHVEIELKSLLKPNKKIDAIFAVNNIIAIACLECLNEMKVKIPEDIALICFDDLSIFKISRPSITAIFQPLEEICKNTVEMLLEEITTKDKVIEKKQMKLPTILKIRNSTLK